MSQIKLFTSTELLRYQRRPYSLNIHGFDGLSTGE